MKKKIAAGAAVEREDRDQVLPPLVDGELATVLEVCVLEKKTRPATRYTEGTLIEAMKNAGTHVEDPALRAVLKQVSGLGTSATRDSILETLKSHKYLTVSGKHLVPTEKGEALIRWLDTHCPELADIALTARWEAELDAIATRGGGPRFEGGIAARVREIVATLQVAAPIAAHPENKNMSDSPQAPRASAPTPKMIDFAKKIATKLGQDLPEGVVEDFDKCRAYLDENKTAASQPSGKQIDFAKSIAQRKGIEVPLNVREDGRALSKWIDANK